MMNEKETLLNAISDLIKKHDEIEERAKAEKQALTLEMGGLLREVRERKNISLRKLAEIVGISPSYLSSMETGIHKCSIDWCKKVFNILFYEADRMRKTILKPSGSFGSAYWGGDVNYNAAVLMYAELRKEMRAFKRVSWDRHPECVKWKSRKLYYRHADMHKKKSKMWRKQNPQRAMKNRKRWLESEKGQEWKNNPETRIVNRLRKRAQRLVRSKGISKSRLCGCTPEFLRCHLEAQFTKRMNWDNYGTYWHIDHIVPCAAFDLTDREEAKRCFNWQNLRPLTARHNISKGANIEDPQTVLPLEVRPSEGAA